LTAVRPTRIAPQWVQTFPSFLQNEHPEKGGKGGTSNGPRGAFSEIHRGGVGIIDSTDLKAKELENKSFMSQDLKKRALFSNPANRITSMGMVFCKKGESAVLPVPTWGASAEHAKERSKVELTFILLKQKKGKGEGGEKKE